MEYEYKRDADDYYSVKDLIFNDGKRCQSCPFRRNVTKEGEPIKGGLIPFDCARTCTAETCDPAHQMIEHVKEMYRQSAFHDVFEMYDEDDYLITYAVPLLERMLKERVSKDAVYESLACMTINCYFDKFYEELRGLI